MEELRQEIRTEYVEDDIREGLIKHWEVQLSNSLEAVRVAQLTLDGLYRSRYREVVREYGSTGYQRRIDAEETQADQVA